MNDRLTLGPNSTLEPYRAESLGSAQRLHALLDKYGWICSLKPRFIADPILRMLDLHGCRTLVTRPDGTRLFVDPFTNFGMQLLRTGAYEPDTVAVFREFIRPGDVVVDV